MLGKRLGSTLAVAVATGGLITGGCAAAATDSATTATGGAVHVVAYSQNSDGPDFTSIITGAVGDFGPAVTVLPNGAVDPEHSSELSLNLRDGSFRLNIANLDKEIKAATHQWPDNPPGCSFHLDVTAPTPVVAGSGTGGYRGISGSVTMTVTIDEVDVSPCPRGTSAFISQLIVMTGTGHLSLGR